MYMFKEPLNVYYWKENPEDRNFKCNIPFPSNAPTATGCTGVSTSCGLKSLQAVAAWVADQLAEEQVQDMYYVNLLCEKRDMDYCEDIGECTSEEDRAINIKLEAIVIDDSSTSSEDLSDSSGTLEEWAKGLKTYYESNDVKNV